MKTVDEFREFYHNELQEAIAQVQEKIAGVEGTGLEGKDTFWSRVLLFAIVTGVLLIPGVFFGPIGILFAVLGGYFAQSVGVKFGRKMHEDTMVQETLKKKIATKIVRFFGPDFDLEPIGKVDKERINESLTFPARVKANHGEDYVSGTVGDTVVEFSEVVLSRSPFATEEPRGLFFSEEQKRHARKVQGYTMGKLAAEENAFFRGLYFIADFHKRFRGHTLLRPRDGVGDPEDRLASSDRATGGRMEPIRLEDPKLESLYRVFGTDQQQARYILSTSMMERIASFRERTGKPVSLSFYDSNMHVAVPSSRDLLEVRSSHSIEDFLADAQGAEDLDLTENVLDREAVFSYFKDLRFILGIVEDFNLNQRIWLKEGV